MAGRVAPVVALAAYVLVHLTQHTIGRHFHFGEETHSVSRARERVGARRAVDAHVRRRRGGGERTARGHGARACSCSSRCCCTNFPRAWRSRACFSRPARVGRKAILAAAALGATTILGVLLTDQLAFLRTYGLAVSAGVTLYVGASNLVPEFQDRPGLRIPVSFVGGCALYFLARSLAPVVVVQA